MRAGQSAMYSNTRHERLSAEESCAWCGSHLVQCPGVAHGAQLVGRGSVFCVIRGVPGMVLVLWD